MSAHSISELYDAPERFQLPLPTTTSQAAISIPLDPPGTALHQFQFQFSSPTPTRTQFAPTGTPYYRFGLSNATRDFSGGAWTSWASIPPSGPAFDGNAKSTDESTKFVQDASLIDELDDFTEVVELAQGPSQPAGSRAEKIVKRRSSKGSCGETSTLLLHNQSHQPVINAENRNANASALRRMNVVEIVPFLERVGPSCYRTMTSTEFPTTQHALTSAPRASVAHPR
jgi:hypothetical protein